MFPSFLRPSSSPLTYPFLKMNPSSSQLEMCLPAVWRCVSRLSNCLIKQRRETKREWGHAESQVATFENEKKKKHLLKDVTKNLDVPHTKRINESSWRHKRWMDKRPCWIQRISSASGQTKIESRPRRRTSRPEASAYNHRFDWQTFSDYFSVFLFNAVLLIEHSGKHANSCVHWW